MKFISGEWLNSARSDIQTIGVILENEHLSHVVAFHAQQCVEKCFKAVIEEYALPSGKIHNLITLKGIVSTVKDFDLDEDLLGLLNSLYVDSRYPGDLGLMPDGRPSLGDARRFCSFAEEVYEAVRSFLSEKETRA